MGRGEESTEGWGVVLNRTFDGLGDEDADEEAGGLGDEAAEEEAAGGGAAAEGPRGLLRLFLGPWTCSWLLVRTRLSCSLMAI